MIGPKIRRCRFRSLGVRATRISIVALALSQLTGCSLNAKLEADPRLAHFAAASPAPGEPAPELSATDVHGVPVSLADLLDGRPLVVQLGSVSCPVFRYRRFAMQSLVEEYGDRVRFVVIYTTEAHPVGAPSPYSDGAEWDIWINRLSGTRVPAALAWEERAAQARRSIGGLDLAQELLVDTIDNATWRAYGAAPSAAFVLDPSGRVIERQMWVRPKILETVLQEILRSGGDFQPSP